jgi:hypothetical protein
MVYMSKFPLIPTAAAIAHFGRAGDGYGGKAALARLLKITIPAIDRWSGPYLPEHHAKKLLQKDHTVQSLVTGEAASSKANGSRRNNRT